MQTLTLNATVSNKKNVVSGDYSILPCSPKKQNSWMQLLAPMLSLHDREIDALAFWWLFETKFQQALIKQ